MSDDIEPRIKMPNPFWIQESRTGMSITHYDYNIGLPLHKVNPLDGEEE